jgi:hypothetical protein
VLVDEVLVEDKGICGVTVANSKKVREELKYYKGDLNQEERDRVKGNIRKILTTIDPDMFKDPSHDNSESEFEEIRLPKLQYEILFHGRSKDEVIEEIMYAVEYYQNIIVPELTQDIGIIKTETSENDTKGISESEAL